MWALQGVRLLTGEMADVIISNGKVKAIVPAGAAVACSTVNAAGLTLSSGWIDMHVHADPTLIPYGDEIDEIGIRSGVTTVVDAGSCGADRIDALAAGAATAKTRVLAFLNVSRIGLIRTDELSEPAWLDASKLADALQRHGKMIVGLKARISRSVVRDQGLAPLVTARQLADTHQLPLMVHIGSAPPDITDVLPWLRKRDILTHFLHGKANHLFDRQGQPLPELQSAIERGVHLDVGHGTASFSFRIAEMARRANLPPDTISTDIYRDNRLNGPVFSMADTLSKFLSLGYSLQQVIAMVTSKAAAWLNRPEWGYIAPGHPADLTLFEVCEGPRLLIDSEGAQRSVNTYLAVRGVVRNGTYFAC